MSGGAGAWRTILILEGLKVLHLLERSLLNLLVELATPNSAHGSVLRAHSYWSLEEYMQC